MKAVGILTLDVAVRVGVGRDHRDLRSVHASLGRDQVAVPVVDGPESVAGERGERWQLPRIVFCQAMPP